MTFGWGNLNKIGQSRALKTSYFWMLIVPVAAKSLARLPDEIELQIWGQMLEINIGLPFSWKMFYFSSVAFSVASLLYSWRCPPIVRKFNTFTEFVEEGRSPPFLRPYARYRHRVEEVLAKYEKDGSVDRDELADAFWSARGQASIMNPKSMVACATLYALGFALISIVLVQNFIYVLKEAFR